MEKKKFNFWRFLFKSIFYVTFIIFLATVFLFFKYGTNLPNYEQLANYKPSLSSRFFAKDGSLLTEYAAEKRIYMELKEIPQNVIDAFISAEDKNFYSHSGVDFTGLARAMLGNIKNVLSGSKKRPTGASTITQQVSKNFFLSSDLSVGRKIKEMILSLKIERTFTKDHILTLYLNKIYLGYYSYGVAAAAHNYFDKSLDQLTLGEAAFLAALPKAPNNYNPISNKDRAIERRNWVLWRMLKNKKINDEQYNTALAEDLVVSSKFNNNLHFYSMYFAEEVRKTVSEQFSNDILYQEGFSVFTTMDPEIQKLATVALKNGIVNYDRNNGYRGPLGTMKDVSEWRRSLVNDFSKPAGIPKTWEMAVVLNVTNEEAEIGLENNSKGVIPVKNLGWARKNLKDQRLGEEIKSARQVLKVGDVILVENDKENSYKLTQNPNVNGAMIVMDPYTGKVFAMVGGYAFEQSKFNRVTQAQRQVGSIIKPFIYLTALQKDEYTPFTILLDAPVVMDRGEDEGLWKPENYEKNFRGNLTLRSALELSRNSPTIRLAQELGISEISDTFRKFGIYNRDMTKSGLSIALGSGETTLIKMAGAFSTFANGGYKITPYYIEKVQDRNGKNIYKNETRECDVCRSSVLNNSQTPAITDNREVILDPQTNYQIISILKGVIERGSGTRAFIPGAYLAGKTGTSSDFKDAWFVGFSDNLLVGIYIGFDKPSSLGNYGSGGLVAAPIFKEFMEQALKMYPSKDFKVPDGITFIRLNKQTGNYAEPGDESVIVEAVKDSQMNKIQKSSEVQPEEEHIIRGKGVKVEQNYDADIGGLY